MIYVVLGMHKSGTTLVSEILHNSGIDMGPFDNDDTSYESGHKYERFKTWKLNEKILSAEKVNSIEINTPVRHDRLTESISSEMKAIIHQMRIEGTDTGFKDPRTCLTYDLWNQHLPEHKLIVVYRNPEASWHRYRSKRNLLKRPFEAWRLLRAWCQHNACILNTIHTTNLEYIVLEYYSLLSDNKEFERLEKFTSCKLADPRQSGRANNSNRNFYPALILVQLLRALFGKYSHTKLLDDLNGIKLMQAKKDEFSSNYDIPKDTVIDFNKC